MKTLRILAIIFYVLFLNIQCRKSIEKIEKEKVVQQSVSKINRNINTKDGEVSCECTC